MTLINREDAIDELRHLIPYKKYHKGKWVYLLDKREVFKAINVLPSADAVQGEWHQISPARIYECSICNHNVLTDYIDTYKYCPSCGTIMLKGGDTKSCVFPQKLVAETFYCADGERKGGDDEV